MSKKGGIYATQAFKRGGAAFRAGTPLDQCPYRKEPSKAKLWREGWHDGARSLKAGQANRKQWV